MWANRSIGRCFLIGGDGITVCQSRGRYKHESPFITCLEESWAPSIVGERGERAGSFVAAGLLVGGAQAIRNAKKPLLYLQYGAIAGRHASRERIEVVVEKNALVDHFWTLC